MKIKNKKSGKLIEVPKHLEADVTKAISLGIDPLSILQSSGDVMQNGGKLPKYDNAGLIPFTKDAPQNNRQSFGDYTIKPPTPYDDGLINPNFMQNDGVYYNPNQNTNTLGQNIITDEPLVNQQTFNPQLTQDLVDYNQSKGRTPKVYGTKEELSQINNKPKFDFQNINVNSFGNQYLAKGAGQLTSGLMNLGKGTVDLIGTNRQNKNELLRNQKQITAGTLNGAENNIPDPYQFGQNFNGANMPLGENGMQIKQIGGYGDPNIEIEGREHVMLPNGFSQEVQGNSHAEGGIPLNLPEGTKIFSEKLKIPVKFLLELIEIDPMYSFLKNISLPKSGNISYADLAKKFETKKYVDLLASKNADPIQKTTAQMMIDKNNQALEAIFSLQEQDKLSGVHGLGVQMEALQEINPEMAKYGKLIKAEYGVFSGDNPYSFANVGVNNSGVQGIYLPYKPNEIWDEYGTDLKLERSLQKFDFRDVEKYSPEEKRKLLKTIRTYQAQKDPTLVRHYKDNFARGNNQAYKDFTSEKGYKKGANDAIESENFRSWSNKNNRPLTDYIDGLKGTDQSQWGHELFNKRMLDFETEDEYNKWKLDKDWKQVPGTNSYVDMSAYDPANSLDPNSVNPDKGVITYYDINKKWEKKSPEKKKAELEVKKDNVKFKSEPPINKIEPNINIPLAFPNMYNRIPENMVMNDPSYIDPRYLDVAPQLNQVTRGQRALQNNLGDRGASNMSNLLQSQINAYGQNQEIYGQKYNYDRGQDASTQQFNAQARMDTGQFNTQANINPFLSRLEKRESNIGDQQLTDQYRALERNDQAIAFNNNKNYIDKTFSNYSKMTKDQYLQEVIGVDPNKFQQTTEEDAKTKKKKSGGIVKSKLKIKPKIKK